METTNSSSKSKREEEKRLKKEKAEKKEKEMSNKIAEIDNAFKNIKLKKETLNQDFLTSIKSILSLWRKKLKNEKLIDELYLATARMIEVALSEKEIANFYEKLSDEEKCDLVKFFYMTYDRCAKKQSCLTLKPAKLYNIHQNILSQQGVGIVSRALFSIQK